MALGTHRRTTARRSARHWGAAAALALALAALPLASPAADTKAGRMYEDALGRWDRHDYAGAAVQARNALQIDQSLLPAHLLLGRALTATGELGTAEAAFVEALRQGVARAEVVLPMARLSLMMGRPDDLMREQRYAVAGLPANVSAQLLLLKAAAAADLGDPRLALRLIDDARALDPTTPESWLTETTIRIRMQ